jgi:hypothetical protein
MIRSMSVIVEARARRPASMCPGNHVKVLFGANENVDRGTKLLYREEYL